jgi:uncharacterized sporulation protein YeaH/YhbH (DUF444 family)
MTREIGLHTPTRIDRDVGRFNQIARGKLRDDLRKHISNPDLVGKKGKNVVTIPINQIQIPRFVHGKNMGGVGQGDGKEGDAIGRAPGQGQEGEGGNQPGTHPFEMEVTIDELTDILLERYHLPYLQPSEGSIQEVERRVKGINQAPSFQLHRKRSYLEALKQTSDPKLASGLMATRPFARYRTLDEEPEPHARAVLILMMDVSASMTQDKKELARTEAFWIESMLTRKYEGLEKRFIAHDTRAGEVTEDVFYSLRQGGGTKISSAYDLCKRTIDEDYADPTWNVYSLHFSDGENYSSDDENCVEILGNILPKHRIFAFVHLGSGRWSDPFTEMLEKAGGIFEDDETRGYVYTRVRKREDILFSMDEMFKKDGDSL